MESGCPRSYTICRPAAPSAPAAEVRAPPTCRAAYHEPLGTDSAPLRGTPLRPARRMRAQGLPEASPSRTVHHWARSPVACCAATPVATGPNRKGRRPTPRADPVGVLVARRSSWTCTPAADELSDQAKRIGAGNGALRQGIRLPQQVLSYPNAFSLSTVLVVTPVLVLGRGRADRAPRGRAVGRTPSRTRRKDRRPQHGWSTRALVRGP